MAVWQAADLLYENACSSERLKLKLPSACEELFSRYVSRGRDTYELIPEL